MRSCRIRFLPAVLAAGALGIGLSAGAEVAVEEIGRVEVLRTPLSSHVAWASDALLRRIALVDLESGRMLGVVDGGYGITAGVFSRRRPEIYVPATYYSRGTRGERTDVVTFTDAVTLAHDGEVVIPPKRAINPLPSANTAISDDDRFLAVFNMTPATSLSVVDLVKRRFAGEIQTPGCSLAYAAGARRFAMLCADGSMLTVTVDDAGREVSKVRSEPFFDPLEDPVTEKAVRRGDTWLFVSFEGWVHPVDVSGATPRFGEPWSLFGESDRAAAWRIGGRQHLAVHRGLGRLYALVHQGPPDTHKQAGSEVWVYDLASNERIQRIELRSPGLTYLGVPLAFGEDWIWPFNRIYDALLSVAPELATGQVAVTQDDKPLLVAGADFSGSLAIYDARSGEFVRRIAVGNSTTLLLQTPWQTVEATR